VYRRSLLALLAVTLGATFARADIQSFTVTLDTSGLSGTGYLDFQFTPDPLGTPGPGAATISQFLSSGGLSLGAELTPLGDVTGSLTAPPLVIGNTFATNDYTQTVNAWGSSLSFLLSLDTAAVDSGFFVTLYDSSFNPLGSLPQGESANLIIDDHGVITPTAGAGASVTAPVPEPAAWTLLATSILVLLGRAFWPAKRASAEK
jgi:hypothetical protein